MLLIITRTKTTWAWVLKKPDQDRAVAVGLGYPTKDDAETGGRLFEGALNKGA